LENVGARYGEPRQQRDGERDEGADAELPGPRWREVERVSRSDGAAEAAVLERDRENDRDDARYGDKQRGASPRADP
jgi:hypothetical protein